MTSNVESYVYTSFTIDNLHCIRFVLSIFCSNSLHLTAWVSCQSVIQEVLEQLQPPPVMVLSSIVGRSVTMQHHKDLSSRTIQSCLRHAGFILKNDRFNGKASQFLRNLGRGSGKIHVDYCRFCQDAQNGTQLRTLEDRSVTPPIMTADQSMWPQR